MPKVIIGETARIENEAKKKMKSYENDVKAKLFLAKKERKMTDSDIASLINLSRQTVGGILNSPLSAKPTNLFKVLTVLGVNL